LDSIQTCHHSDRLRISNFNIRFLKRYLRVSITNFNSKMIRFRIRCLYLNDLYKDAVEDCLRELTNFHTPNLLPSYPVPL
jgi:hypothetical protein